MSKRVAGYILTAFALALWPQAAPAETCSGCACRGGPGYRDAKGRCVAHSQLYSRCGVVPTTRCTFEGAAQIGRGAVPPDWSPAQHAQWLATRGAAKRLDATSTDASAAP